jgi:TPR repeat protein
MHPFNKAIVLTAAIALAPPVLGQSLDEGVDAYRNGDYATTLENFEPLAEQGDASAQYNLGVMYANGEGVPQNASTSAEWYRKAAEQGHADAQFKLSASYYLDEGVSHNPVMAYVLANLAAAQGHEKGRELRDLFADELSRDQIAEGQRMASEWRVGTPLPYFKDFSTWP